MKPDPQKLLPLPVAFFQILVALAGGERHGYAIMQDVAERTGGKLKLSPGTLYGAIRRLLELGVIVEVAGRPDPGEDDERRRYYRITPFGQKVAVAEAARLASLVEDARERGWLPERG